MSLFKHSHSHHAHSHGHSRRHGHGHGRKQNRRQNQRDIRKPIAAFLLLAVVFGAVYFGGNALEKRSLKPEPRGDYRLREQYEDTVSYRGLSYRKRTGITTILLMGIDKEGDQASDGGRFNGGQADFLQLIAVDSVNSRIMRLEIDRDTMTPITVLGVLGNRSGVRTAQISLSHGFGNGEEQSCELTVDAVSNLLLGTSVDFYFALSMDGIDVLNDLVGGVTVTLEDDFSASDPTMTVGTTLTLQGHQAEIYARARREVGEGTNEERMRRQRAFIDGFIEKADALQREDENFWGNLFDGLSDYMVTNMTRGRLINEAWAGRDYARIAPLSIQGEHKVGSDGFMQFHADEESVQAAVLEMFYEQAK